LSVTLYHNDALILYINILLFVYITVCGVSDSCAVSFMILHWPSHYWCFSLNC